MRIAFETHGCRLNRADTEAMQARVRAAGHELCAGPRDADVYVLNGCTITHQADADARAALRRARRQNPDVRVVVTGCYANAAADQLAEAAGVDVVLGNLDKAGIEQVLAGGRDRGLVRVTDLTRRVPYSSLPAAPSADRSRAHLKVQDGCNYQCAFCIVPRVRGRSRSLALEHAVAQLRGLVEAGVPEIVVTGVHLGTWGWDRGDRRGVAGLLEGLLPHLGDARVRFGSLDPHEVDHALVRVMRDAGERMCRHLHLPVQSGDEGVLAAMRRGHGVAELREVTTTLARELPGIAIGTDVIVGFPGESEAAFARTLALVEQLPIAYVHAFTYSVRVGTEAASMRGQVEATTKARRSEALRTLSRRKWQAFREGLVGRELDVVVHRTRHARTGKLVALSSENVKVELEGPDGLLGQRVRVRLRAVDGARSLAEASARAQRPTSTVAGSVRAARRAGRAAPSTQKPTANTSAPAISSGVKSK